MANSDHILTDPKRSHLGILVVSFLAPFVLITLGSWIWNLQTQIDLLQQRNNQLYERSQEPPMCPEVLVTCECPEYDEGWDDAQHADGCDPGMSEMSIEELRVVCDELDSFGYVPGC